MGSNHGVEMLILSSERIRPRGRIVNEDGVRGGKREYLYTDRGGNGVRILLNRLDRTPLVVYKGTRP